MKVEQIKALIRSIVQSSPEAVTVHRLNRDFKEEEGVYIPYHDFGHNSLESFLRSMSDTVLLNGSGPQALVYAVSSKKSAHIQELVAHQKNSKPRARNRRGNTPNVQRTKYNYPQTKHVVNKFVQPRSVQKSVPSQLYSIYAEKPAALLPTPPVNPCQWPGMWQVQHPMQQAQLQHQAQLQQQHQMQQAQLQQQQQMQQAQLQRQVQQAQLQQKQAQLHQHYINIQKAANNIKYQRQQQPQQRKNPQVTDKLAKEEPQIKQKQQQENEIKCKENVKQSLDVVSTISSTVKSDLTTSEPVTQTTSSLISSKITANKNLSQLTNSFKEMNFSDSSSNDNKIYTNYENQGVPDFAVNELVCRLDFPDFTVKLGESLKECKIPVDLKKDDTFALYVTEVHNPFKFWFHIDKDNHELDLLMNNMEHFYSDLSLDALRIPTKAIVPSQICAALYHQHWHRACILTNVANQKVKVYFVDYGTISSVNEEEIKYLATKFSYLPMQALRGSLSHIKPRENYWPTKTTQEFLKIVFDKLLYAKVSEINEKHNVIYMIMCDTNDEKNTIQINSELVKMGHAAFDESWREERIKEVRV